MFFVGMTLIIYPAIHVKLITTFALCLPWYMDTRCRKRNASVNQTFSI